MWLAIWAAGRVQEHLDWWKEENFFQKIIFFLGAECQALCRAVNGAVYFSHYNKVRPVPAQDILKHAPPFQGDDFRNDYEGHCGCFSTCPWPGSFSCRNSCDDDVRNSHKCHCMRSVNVMMTSWHHNLSFQRIAATRCDQLHIMRDRKMLRNFHFCKSIKVLSSFEFNNDKVIPRFGSHWRSYDWWFFSTGVLTVFVIGQSLYQVSISVPQYNGQWRLQSDSEASRYTLCESVSSIIIFISTLQPEARPACSPITKWPIFR